MILQSCKRNSVDRHLIGQVVCIALGQIQDSLGQELGGMCFEECNPSLSKSLQAARDCINVDNSEV